MNPEGAIGALKYIACTLAIAAATSGVGVVAAIAGCLIMLLPEE